MPKTLLLIVEDYEPIVTLLRSTLHDEFDVTVAGTVEQASVLIKRATPQLVLLDLGLPPHSSPEQGLSLLRAMQLNGCRCKTVVCTGYSERDLAVRAVQYGAYDVLYKPLDLAALRGILMRARWLVELEEEARQDTPDSMPGSDLLDQMLGSSLGMRPVQEAIRKLAMSDMPVLITGESGTGKKLIARAIHEQSERATQRFVPVACGAIPGMLFDAELLGSESDGDSAAPSRKRGKLESAKGGTLFFDEVEDLPPDSQRTVLRAMEEQAERADVRIMASSKRSPQAIRGNGLIQPDLYRRFVMHISLPALREHGDDVSVLGKIFLRRFAFQQDKSILGFTKEASDAMRAHAWPGNIRELAARIQRAVVVAGGEYLDVTDLDLQKNEPQQDSISLKVNQQRIETDLIMKAFTLSRGNLSRAAQELGISRSTLYRRIRQYGLGRAADANMSS